MRKINLLIFLSATLAIAGAHYGQIELHRIFKPLTTILIIAGLCQASARPLGGFTRLILYALIACLAGDTLLMFDSLFLFGMVAFLLGHLAFMVAFVRAQSVAGGWRPRIMPLMMLLFPAGYYYSYLFDHLGAFTVPVGMYSLIIVLMCWQAISLMLALPTRDTKLLGFASVLFMFSDAVIAANKFVAPVAYSALIILITYWLSIWLIARIGARWREDQSVEA